MEENNIQYDAVTGLSLYEQRRLENIERNKRILESLGLGKAKAAISNTLKKKKVKLKSTKKRNVNKRIKNWYLLDQFVVQDVNNNKIYHIMKMI